MQTTTVYYTSIYPSYANVEPQTNSSANEQPNSTSQVGKRRQVKNACTNCQKACKKCDDARPCHRCVKYSIPDSCVSSVRKERKKGIKRGPYKRRQKSNQESTQDQTRIQADHKEPVNHNNNTSGIKQDVSPAAYSYPPNLNQYGYYGSTASELPSHTAYTKDHIQEYVLPMYSPYPGVSQTTEEPKEEMKPVNKQQEEENSKYARLTQLCSAALKENAEVSSKD
ncbi:hypothetical protein BY458DRAFT_497421 [Sporodiniella umbellata]|nr:hypothetical protein BY458DRAFT_497421 [Sporodiniella umbellata]